MPVKKTTTVKQPFWSEKDIKPSLKSKPLNHRQSLANKKSSRPREKMLLTENKLHRFKNKNFVTNN